MALGSISASAIDKVTLKDYKDQKSNLWVVDKDNNNQIVYFENGDIVKNKWLTRNIHTFYMNENGFMTIGWKNINNNWYWFDNDGFMAKGWIINNNNWYYFNADGTMAHDTTIDGYYINSSGVWVK